MNAVIIVFYGVEEYEKPILKKAAKDKGIQVKCVSTNANETNMDEAKECQGVCITSEQSLNPTILKKWNEYGITGIVTRSVGYENIDVNLVKEHGMKFTNITYSTSSVADYTVMLMMMLLRNMKETQEEFKRKNFSLGTPGKELRSLTVGIVGAGNIGRTVMERLQSFGCKVLFYTKGDYSELGDRVEFVDFQELLQRSDIITLHVPSSPDTYHLINSESMKLIKDGAFIINTGRGDLIDTPVLIDALRSGKIQGAALDVLEGEVGIYYQDCRERVLNNLYIEILDTMPNVILTPHTAFFTEEAVTDMINNSMDAYLEGKTL